MLAPDELRELLITSLTDDDTPAFGQVATIDDQRIPQVRTVHYRYVQDRDAFGFGAHIRSPKWDELSKRAILSGCYFDQTRHFQFRWIGEAELLSGSRTSDKDSKLIQVMWDKMRPDVRSCYWLLENKLSPLSEMPSDVDISTPCPSMGFVLCKAKIWDVYDVSDEDYRKGSRIIYSREGNAWSARAVSMLDSSPL